MEQLQLWTALSSLPRAENGSAAEETVLYPQSPYLIVEQNVLLFLCILQQQTEAFFLLPQGAFICSASPFPVSQRIYIINVWTKCCSHSSLCSQKQHLHEEDKQSLAPRF